MTDSFVCIVKFIWQQNYSEYRVTKNDYIWGEMRMFSFITGILLFLFKYPVSAQIQYLEAFKYQGKTKAEIQKEKYIEREERKEAREQRKLRRLEKKMIKKHHKKLQDKKTYKRMKKSRKKSQMYNENKREFFLKRWFKNKRKVK